MIVISYRREDSTPIAGRLHDRLRAEFRSVAPDSSPTRATRRSAPSAIIDAADKRNWENVRQELDRTQNSVQQAMNEVHNEKLSQLVSLGGWLRGTEVLTSVVKQHFSNDGAELLHQPDLLTYFQTRLQAMSEFNLPIVHQIQDALVEVKPLINIGNARISAESVKKVNEITTRLGNDIIKKD
jgi:PHD/YefM family antitoxin component YafN of YafNO toxin-antitoxin module